MNRKKARKEAFAIIFESIFRQDTDVNSIIEREKEDRGIEFDEYMTNVITGVASHEDELDRKISSYLKTGWSLSRISKVSVAILRLAFYEIIYMDDIPGSVTINEAVELSKTYDVDNSSFINGVLSAFLKDREEKTEE